MNAGNASLSGSPTTQQHYHAFLSHNGADKPSVEQLGEELEKRGLYCWLDNWNLVPGDPWQPAIEEALGRCDSCVVFFGPHGLGPWHNEEMRLAIRRHVNAHERQFRVLPVILPRGQRAKESDLPGFLQGTTWVEFRQSINDETALHRLVCGIKGIPPGRGPRATIQTGDCPYLGLKTFQPEDAPLFFGRDAKVQELVDRLRNNFGTPSEERFLALLVAIVAMQQGISARRAENNAQAAAQKITEVAAQANQAASQANVSLARYSQEAGNDAEALAHLVQALRLNQRNYEAATLTGAMLTQTNWPLSVTALIGHDSVINFAQFSPDGRLVVTASSDRTARLWDVASGKPMGKPMKHGGSVYSARFSPDGRLVVTASSDGTARLWDVASGKPVGETMEHEDLDLSQVHRQQIDAPKYDLDELDNDLVVIDGLVIDKFTVQGLVNSAQFSPDGRRVVTASKNRTARVWEVPSGKPIGEVMKHADAVRSAQFSPDGQRVVTACSDGMAQLWDAASGKPIGEPMKHTGSVRSAWFSPDGQRVVTAYSDGTAQLWNTLTSRPIDEPMKHQSWVNSARFSPDGQRVVSASSDETAQLWDAISGKPIGEPMKHTGWVYSAQFSPDGQRVVTASSDETARLWDAISGKPIGEPMKHHGWVNSAQFSPNGQRVVSASSDKTARLWEAASGRSIGQPMVHEDAVSSAQFSPNGQLVVSSSSDGTARLWDAASGKPIGDPMKHTGSVRSAQFSPDGQSIVTSSSDGTVQLWNAAAVNRSASR
jgi:WD40 repeat protein